MHAPGHRSPIMPVSIMASSSASLTGGTPRQCSSRTPRRVQWATNDDVRMSVDSESSPSPRQDIQVLDEPNAMEALNCALQQHLSLCRSDNDLHRPRKGDGTASVPSASAMSHWTRRSPRTSTSVPQTQQNPFATAPLPTWHFPSHYTNSNTTVSWESAGPSQMTAGSSSSCVDPPGREELPLEHKALDFPNTGAGFNARQGSNLENEDTEAGQKTIEPLAAHQAARLVSVHTRRGWLHPRAESSHSRGRDKEIEGRDKKLERGTHRFRGRRYAFTSDTDNDTDFTDIEIDYAKTHEHETQEGSRSTGSVPNVCSPHTLPQPHRCRRAGAGVLSALLAFYNHDHDYEEEESVSGSSSPGWRSCASSDTGSKQARDLQEAVQLGIRGRDEGNSKEAGLGVGRSLKSSPGSASSVHAHLEHPSQSVAGAGSPSSAGSTQHTTLPPSLRHAEYGPVGYSKENVPTTGQGQDPMTGYTKRPVLRVRTDLTSSESLLTTPERRTSCRVVLEDLTLPSSSHFKELSHSFTGTPWEEGSSTPIVSGSATPQTASTGETLVDEFGEKDYFGLKCTEKEKRRTRERERKEREREKNKEKKKKRKDTEIYITRHIASILQRQEFIMKLARAMMMFAGPSHRLAKQIQCAGRVLDLELSCMYLPDTMLISFEDSATGTSNLKLIRQSSALDLQKLGEASGLYWKVIHDEMSASVASTSLDILMHKEPLYNFTQLILIGGLCSASICSLSFSGSFIDSLVSAPLGALLILVQLLSVRNELYGNMFEITIVTLLSFISAALASTKHLCYSAVANSSMVLILPGFIVLCGCLEFSSRSLVAGAVRLCFALMYSLFLGFGLAIGAELYKKLTGQSVVGATDFTCVDSHNPMGPWWQRTPSLWWAFLTVPMYSSFLSMRLMIPWRKKELILLVAISCIKWVTNHFVSTKFPNQNDVTATVSAFAVGFVSNLYGRIFNENAFVLMVTGILFQVPSDLGNGGLLNFVSDRTSGSSASYLSGFETVLQLIWVAIGLTAGLEISLVIVHPVQNKRRTGGLFSL